MAQANTCTEEEKPEKGKSKLKNGNTGSNDEPKPDFAFAIAVDRLMIRSALYITALKTAIEGLAPLDELPHDQILAQDQLPHGIHHNEVVSRVFAAKGAATDAVSNLQKAVAELEGVFKGPDRDRFQEPAKRTLKQAEKLANRMEELMERTDAERPNRVFAVRAQIASGLALQAGELRDQIQQNRERFNDSFPDFLDALSAVEENYDSFRITFTKLRDNPSQKCLRKLEEAAQKANSVHETLALLKYYAYPIPQFRPSRLN